MSWADRDGRRRCRAGRADKLITMMNIQTSPAGRATSPDGAAIRMTGLRKSFGHIQAVRGVDLAVAPGEVVAFLGPNGAGKSTTIDMLLGLTRPDAGSVCDVSATP